MLERPQLWPQLWKAIPSESGQQRLSDRPVGPGHSRSSLDASPAERSEPSRLRHPFGFASEARLADAGLAKQKEASAVAVARCVERGGNCAQLLVPTDYPWAQYLAHTS